MGYRHTRAQVWLCGSLSQTYNNKAHAGRILSMKPWYLSDTLLKNLLFVELDKLILKTAKTVEPLEEQ